jgi:hypothetical protein
MLAQLAIPTRLAAYRCQRSRGHFSIGSRRIVRIETCVTHGYGPSSSNLSRKRFSDRFTYRNVIYLSSPCNGLLAEIPAGIVFNTSS